MGADQRPQLFRAFDTHSRNVVDFRQEATHGLLGHQNRHFPQRFEDAKLHRLEAVPDHEITGTQGGLLTALTDDFRPGKLEQDADIRSIRPIYVFRGAKPFAGIAAATDQPQIATIAGHHLGIEIPASANEFPVEMGRTQRVAPCVKA